MFSFSKKKVTYEKESEDFEDSVELEDEDEYEDETEDETQQDVTDTYTATEYIKPFQTGLINERFKDTAFAMSKINLDESEVFNIILESIQKNSSPMFVGKIATRVSRVEKKGGRVF